ncbi:hypothetical protein [Flavilitoribacter nigricans]|uniref:HEAT repeat domain-containing protein n=1 Tax=Flavilitoribacter nigricans (strain ATCC 23147 / DSM 23189 / NBRC 102662 / NCIMB 1420 / SS-2) TaxID=1122177 RepID=A0A2D0N292_FLAN2|nr:hypothetical protein [Flavilitoribacter nigricans]PHN02508.1 hypothetical protein CRP01_31520 [Flavilitoribacter nigricans DSM 23189 = NBRC 102662]
MLEKLDDIQWERLKHAYGPARDVPTNIRDLASPDAEKSDKAMYNLYGNIFHQGSRYESTPYAIPFLWELIQEDTVRDKPGIIGLLVNLALGYEDEYLPEGIDVQKFREDLLEREARMTNDQRAYAEKYGYSNSALLECYTLVRDGVPLLYECLESGDEELSKAAVYAMAWFPELAETSVARISSHLKRLEDEVAVSNAILAIGLLARQSGLDEELLPVKAYLNSDSQLVKVCAAIALAGTPMEEAVLETLIEGLAVGEPLHYVEGMLFNEGRLSGYLSKVLSGCAIRERGKVISALSKALETANAYQALDLTRSLLSLINETRAVPLREAKRSALNASEVEALRAIYQHGGWTLGQGDFVNYLELLKAYGIPDSRTALAGYLALSDS